MKDYSDLVYDKVREWQSKHQRNTQPNIIIMNNKDLKSWILYVKDSIPNFAPKKNGKIFCIGAEIIRSKDLKKGEIRIY